MSVVSHTEWVGTGRPARCVVVLASAVWDHPVELNAHGFARRLASRGWRVLFVESTGMRVPRLRQPSDRRRVLSRLRGLVPGRPSRETGGVAVHSPVMPSVYSPLTAAVAARVLTGGLRRRIRSMGWTEYAVVAMLPWHHRVVTGLAPARSVYLCVDAYDKNPGVYTQMVRADEQRLCRSVDTVVATSPALSQKLLSEQTAPVLIENGADVGVFRDAIGCPETGLLDSFPRPHFLFSGNLVSYKVSVESLSALLERTSGGLVLAGPIGLGADEGDPAVARLLEHPRVRHLGVLDRAALASVMARCDAGLIPSNRDGVAADSMPLKLREYLASGLPVVAIDTPGIAGCEGDITRCQPGVDFAEAAVRVARDQRLPDERLAASAAADPWDWEKRVDQLEELLGVGARAEAAV